MKSKYILGISAYFHDSSACLIRDDEIIAASAEERYTRVKHDPSFPTNAIKFCLNHANIRLDDISYVVFYEKPFVTFERLMSTYLRNSPRGFSSFKMSAPLWFKNKLFIRSRINEELEKLADVTANKIPKVIFSTHHLSHAASAFYPSPFENAAILCMDGVGEYATTSIWHGRGRELNLVKQINFPHSLGLLYSAFTYFCGFKVNNGEYKLMGLAPYGKPIYVDAIKNNLIKIFEDGSYELNPSYFNYETGLEMTSNKFGQLFNSSPRSLDSNIDQKYKDLAASIQAVTEEVIIKLVNHTKEVTGEENICLAGGVALNCVANGKLIKERIAKNLWIQPAASDSGGAIGAAFATLYNLTDHPRVIKQSDSMKGCYLGEEFTDEEIEKALIKNNMSYTRLDETTLIHKSAELILADYVLGWFQGRTEFGPRALGARSILGNANSKELKNIINAKIKFRESFRPFAASILKEDASLVFEEIGNSPYMLLVDRPIDNSKYPAITHVDGTTRIQTLDDNSHPKFLELLKEIKEKTDCGIVINTSFNVRGEPIINSPQDAIDCFMNTDMDHLIIGPFHLDKENQIPIQKNENTPKVEMISISFYERVKSLSNLLILSIVFYVILTPYFLILRMFQNQKMNPTSNWQAPEELKVSDEMF